MNLIALWFFGTFVGGLMMGFGVGFNQVIVSTVGIVLVFVAGGAIYLRIFHSEAPEAPNGKQGGGSKQV